MIEFCILNSLETAQVEQNKRRMRGIYVKPETGVAGSYLNASTGIIYTLVRYMPEFKILPMTTSPIAATRLPTCWIPFRSLSAMLVTSCTEDMDLDRHVLYLNKTHLPGGLRMYAPNMERTLILPVQTATSSWFLTRICVSSGCLDLGQLPLMFIDVPGNPPVPGVRTGRDASIKVRDDMELVKAWSTWKEGCAASFTGSPF